MRIVLIIILIFLGTTVAEGIFLPGLFHIYGGLLGFAFLASLLLVYGNEPNVLVMALLAALILELWRGFYLASVISAFIFSVGIWQVLSYFFNIEPLINHSRIYLFSLVSLLAIGYLLVAGMSVVFLAVEKYIYRADITWDTLRLAALSPAVWFVTGCGLLICTVLMRLPDGPAGGQARTGRHSYR